MSGKKCTCCDREPLEDPQSLLFRAGCTTAKFMATGRVCALIYDDPAVEAATLLLNYVFDRVGYTNNYMGIHVCLYVKTPGKSIQMPSYQMLLFYLLLPKN